METIKTEDKKKTTKKGIIATTCVLVTLFMATLCNGIDQFISKRWDHNLSNGMSFSDRMMLFGVSMFSSERGEILYKGECDLEVATANWMGSETHRNIMKDKEYKYMIALMLPFVDTDNEEKCYIVVNYAKD